VDMTEKHGAVLVVSSDKEFCGRMRHLLEQTPCGNNLVDLRDVSAARKFLFEQRVEIIVFDVPRSTGKVEIEALLGARVDATATSLAVHAPVVVIGKVGQREELKALIAAGVVDFVERGRSSMQKVLVLVERRLSGMKNKLEGELMKAIEEHNDFGQTLRHELNNPLTGILGNAELLLAEIRRKDDGKLPSGGQQRVETIAALAVRLRETIRRLSVEWESRQQPETDGSREVTVQG
jgi:signal transduction histidine kinase